MLDNPSSAEFARDALSDTLGLLPDAPLAMPKQVLEAKRARLSDLVLPVLRLFGGSTPRPGPRPGL